VTYEASIFNEHNFRWISQQPNHGEFAFNLGHVFTSGPIYWVDLMKRKKIPTECHGDGQDYGALCHNFLTPKDIMKSSFKASHIITHLEGIIRRFISKQ